MWELLWKPDHAQWLPLHNLFGRYGLVSKLRGIRMDEMMGKCRKGKLWLLMVLAGALILGGCANGSGSDAGTPPILAKDELQGKLFVTGTNYYSFEDGQVVYLDCSTTGYGLVSLPGKDVVVRLGPKSNTTNVVAVIYRNGAGYDFRLFDGDQKLSFFADGRAVDEDDNRIYGELGSGELDAAAVSELSSKENRGFILYKDGVKVTDNAEAIEYMKSSPSEPKEFAVCMSLPIKNLKSPDKCVELVQMPYKISGDDVNLEWRNGKAMDGSNAYEVGPGTATSIFGFTSQDEPWSSVVKGESYLYRSTLPDGSTSETTITRANSLPMPRQAFKTRKLGE